MTTLIVTANSVGAGARVTLPTGEDLMLAPGVTIGSTTGTAIAGNGSSHDVLIQGAVVGNIQGVFFGLTTATNNAVRILAGGSVFGGSSAVQFSGSGNVVDNAGSISADSVAVSFAAASGSASFLFNSGEITSGASAVSASAVALTVVNTGEIRSLTLAIATGGGADRITNLGTLVGQVSLGDNDDRMDNRDGVLTRDVILGNGDDTFLPGGGAETVDGGAGSDTLDFRGAGRGVISLRSDDGTGRAEGDSYAGFENVLGSRGSADTILGGAESNVLSGFGGNDSLNGGGGNDALVGGLGVDRLRGGLGNDNFSFLSVDEVGDAILDFSQVAFNSDLITISASGFGGGLVAGALPVSQFEARSNNRAVDAGDRFIFRTTDATLWFDTDGTGAAGPVMVADFADGAVLDSFNIVLIA